jgi:hypothetical protein
MQLANKHIQHSILVASLVLAAVPARAQQNVQPTAAGQGASAAVGSTGIPDALRPDVPRGAYDQPCLRVNGRPGIRLAYKASPSIGLRLGFASKVAAVSNATPRLWDVSSYERSVWIRPRTESTYGDRVGVTISLENGNYYDFIVVRSDSASPSNSCVLIRDPNIARRKKPVKNTSNQGQSAQIELLQTQKVAIEEIRRQTEKQASDQVRAFQYSINTSYVVTSKTKGLTQFISAAFDDGRTTYIRIKSTGYGLPTLTAKGQSRDQVLQYIYDDITGVYAIIGLFDTIQVKLGDNLILLQRKG